MQVVRLLLVAFIRGVQLTIENPLSSLLWMYQPMKTFVHLCCPYQVTTYLGAFGAKTEKGLVLRSSMDSITEVKRKRPKKETLSVRDSNGAVTGKRKDLKQSQAYTRKFGEALATLVKENGCSSNSGQCEVW